jgi:hypothetical protein
MKEKGNDEEYLLEQTVKQVNVHASEVEQKLKEQIEKQHQAYKDEITKTIEGIRAENGELREALEALKSKLKH